MPTYTRHISSSGHRDDVILTWTVHLAREHPVKLIYSLGAIILASIAGYYTLSTAGAVATALVMFVSVADFVLPVRYTITIDGAKCNMFLKSAEIRWQDIKRCYIDDTGIKLSPLGRRSRLEAFRGVYLRFKGNKEQVLETVQSLRKA